jgi:acetyl-CoA C-acetyltransferase
MREVVIVNAVRTAVGAFGKSLKDIPATKLGAAVIKEVISRSHIHYADVNEVIMGNVLQSGLGQNPARQSAIEAGLPVEVSAFTVNKVCGSGLKAVNLAAQAIATNDADIIVAGGMENMSSAPYLTTDLRWGGKMGDRTLVDTLLKDGLSCPFNKYHMGITAENVAEKFKISRQEQDAFAFHSQQKAGNAIANKIFADEIIPIELSHSSKNGPTFFDTDEHPRQDTSIEKLSQLKPSFKKEGTITPGNASGINDGAAAVVITSKETAEKSNLEIMATIKSYASSGVEPSIMGIGPVFAIRKALDKAGLRIGQIDLFELNEAFASQSLAVIQELHLDVAKVNVNGGAIALGHPLGASGARILTTLLYEMKRRKVRYGIAALCIGGGEGIATIVERR